MSINLLDSVKGFFSNDLIAKASSMLGESEGGIQKALTGIVPSVLTGIISKASSGGAGSILSMATEASNQGMAANVGNFFGENLLSKGADMLKGIFGDKMSDVASAVSGYSGIKATSAASLMNIAAPAALATIGKQAQATGMNSSSLLSMLSSQKDAIIGALPSGLNLAGVLGLGSLGSIGQNLSGALGNASGRVSQIAETKMPDVRPMTGIPKWVVPAILALIVLGLIWYFMRSKEPVDQMAGASTTTQDSTPPPAALATTSIKVKLPDGTELDANKGGIEDQLVNYLNNADSKIDKATWFDFDNLNFETGSAKITSESEKQIQNITAILKAFPKAVIKIGGYTDKSGDSSSNMKLSQARANAVEQALKNNHTNTAQLAGAEGYGSQFAKAAADGAEADKKMDRRIAVNVRAK